MGVLCAGDALEVGVNHTPSAATLALFLVHARLKLRRGQGPLIAETGNCVLLIRSSAHTSEAFECGELAGGS